MVISTYLFDRGSYNMNSDIKIYVSKHREFHTIQSDIIETIWCGNLSKKNKRSDSQGDNISNLNDKFCELTTLYWAWKNEKRKYFGFFHYRRFMSFNLNKTKNIYSEFYFDDETIKEHCLNDANIREIVNNYDLILPKKDTLNCSLYEQYKNSNGHFIEDLDLALEILISKYPNFKKWIEVTKKQNYIYFFNIFIAKNEIFNNYCEWLFPILFELNNKIDFQNRNFYSNRVVGFVAERLFNVYVNYLIDTQNVKYCELPIIFVKNEICLEQQVKKGNIPVVLACDDKYTKYAGLLIESILKNNISKKNYDFYIISNAISERNWNKLLILKNNHLHINEIIKIDAEKYFSNNNLNERNHLNKTTFLRLGILDFMKNFEKVIYLDCDTVVNNDLWNLFKIDISNYSIAAVLDTVHQSFYNIDINSKQNTNCNKIGIENKWNYFNAGVLLMNVKKMNQKISYKELLNDCVEKKYFWQDQDCLNVWFQNETLLIDNKWNCMSHSTDNINESFEINAPNDIFFKYKEAIKDPWIVHYAGRTIPTFCSNSYLDFVFWKYAKFSIFYEDLLRDMCLENNLILEKNIFQKKKKNNLIRRLVLKYKFLRIVLKPLIIIYIKIKK